MTTPGSSSPSSESPKDPSTEQLRIRKGFWLSVIGLVLAASLVVLLLLFGWKTASDIVAVVGLFTSVLGTLVGAFFGLQIGASDKAKAEERADSAEKNLKSLLGAASSETLATAKDLGFSLL